MALLFIFSEPQLFKALGAMRASTRPCARAALIFVLALAACQKTVNPPPPGYVDSCYGGDFRKFREGSRPHLTMYVPATEKDWENLRVLLRDFSEISNLDHFDMSKSDERVRMVAVSLCSSSGIAIDLDERIYASGRHPDFHPEHAVIYLRGYKDSYNWQALGVKLSNYFRDNWPGETMEEWFNSRENGT